jgi:hypothetical protein
MKVHLPFREPQLGKDYWIEDNVLLNPMEVAERCVGKITWTLGSPWRSLPWPGMRAPDALTSEELSIIESCVNTRMGIRRLKPQSDTEIGLSGHNNIQIVGGEEGVARPHVDSAKICDVAGVLYLHPNPPTPHCGTSFYRLRFPGERPGGNVCPREYESLSEVPGFPHIVEPTMFEEVLEVKYVFNRLVVYRSDLIHSASSYFGCGHDMTAKRMAVVFFWKVEGDDGG